LDSGKPTTENKKRKQSDVWQEEYALQFGLDAKAAKSAVLFRVRAAEWHDKAEKYEDGGNKEQADIFWNKAEECLRKHFELLEKFK